MLFPPNGGVKHADTSRSLYSLDAVIVDFESWSSVSRWAAARRNEFGDDDEGGGAATSFSLVPETHVVS